MDELTYGDIERMAKGVATGYIDRDGTPIRVGDNVIYYKKCTALVGREEAKAHPDEYIVGTGAKGYVYTGKVIRKSYIVEFSFHDGLKILDGYKWKYLYETGADGRLLTILVDNEHRNPKLTFEQVITDKSKEEQ